MDKTLTAGNGYKLYTDGNLFFVDIGQPVNHGYDTIRGAVAALYYSGMISSAEAAGIVSRFSSFPQVNYMNAETGEITTNQRDAVDWYRDGVRVLLYTFSGSWKYRTSWDH